MNKTIFLALIIIGLNLKLSAQTQYPKGCYMSLEELKTKTPSEDFNLEIIKRTTGDIRMNGGNDYKLESPDKSVPKKTLKKAIWAISDGENLYINCLQQKCQLWYAIVESEENELIFNGGVSSSEAATAAALGGAIGGAAIATKRYKYSLDLNTGIVKRIDDK